MPCEAEAKDIEYPGFYSRCDPSFASARIKVWRLLCAATGRRSLIGTRPCGISGLASHLPSSSIHWFCNESKEIEDLYRHQSGAVDRASLSAPSGLTDAEWVVLEPCFCPLLMLAALTSSGCALQPEFWAIHG